MLRRRISPFLSFVRAKGKHLSRGCASESVLEDALPIQKERWPSWAIWEPVMKGKRSKRKMDACVPAPCEYPSMSSMQNARINAGCSPGIRGQALMASILRMRDGVAILHADTDVTCTVPSKEILPNLKEGEKECYVRVGKDMELDPRSSISARRLASAWDALRESMRAKQKVRGRVLNAVNGGHAVGVAGYVAFLPSSRCRPSTSARLGVLQDFLVLSMNESTKNVVVAEPHASGSRKDKEHRKKRMRREDKHSSGRPMDSSGSRSARNRFEARA